MKSAKNIKKFVIITTLIFLVFLLMHMGFAAEKYRLLDSKKTGTSLLALKETTFCDSLEFGDSILCKDTGEWYNRKGEVVDNPSFIPYDAKLTIGNFKIIEKDGKKELIWGGTNVEEATVLTLLTYRDKFGISDKLFTQLKKSFENEMQGKSLEELTKIFGVDDENYLRMYLESYGWEFEAGKVKKVDEVVEVTKLSKTGIWAIRVGNALSQFIPSGRIVWPVIKSIIWMPEKQEGKETTGRWWKAFVAAMRWDPDETYTLSLLRFTSLIMTDISSTVASAKLASNAGEAIAEKPFSHGAYCRLCNWDNYTICTQERCNILGGASGMCKYVKVEDDRQGLCVPIDCDRGIPKMEDLKVIFYSGEKELKRCTKGGGGGQEGQCQVSGRGGGTQINAKNVSYELSQINISFDTDIPASCRYKILPAGQGKAKYSEMNLINGEENFLETGRSFVIAHNELIGLEPGKTYRIYLKCDPGCFVDVDKELEAWDWDYIEFKIDDRPTWEPPRIIRITPDDKLEYVADNLNNITISLIVDDPNADCFYSTPQQNLTIDLNQSCESGASRVNCSCTEDNLSIMCEFGIMPKEIQNYVLNSRCYYNARCIYTDEFGNVRYTNSYKCTLCNITINLSDENSWMKINWSEIADNVANFQEACKTQPSQPGCQEFAQAVTARGIDLTQAKNLGINKIFALNFRCGAHGVFMPKNEVYEYRLLTFPPYDLNVTYETPGEGIEKSVIIKINASRTVRCRYVMARDDTNYDTTDFENMTLIDSDNFYNYHEVKIENLRKGKYKALIKCRDLGNLEKYYEITGINITNAGLPNIIRMSSDGYSLYIETDIKAKCVFSIDNNKGCVFDATNATEFSTQDNINHVAPLNKEWTYYVKCIDIWQDNDWPRNCTTIIKPFELTEIFRV